MVPYFIVKEAFEVCGIMDNLFLPRKTNKHGHIYGFVRFANVRDAEKLLKALNNITFGQFCVWAKFARFDRKPLEQVEPRGSEGVRGVSVVRKKEELKKDCEGDKSEHGVKNKEDGGDIEHVRKDERLGKVKVREEGGQGGGVGVRPRDKGLKGVQQHVVQKSFVANVQGSKAETNNNVTGCKLVRSYKSKADDLLWARKGVIATILNGEVIPIIQTRIVDAGLHELDIIPVGADKVYIWCVSNTDVMTVMVEAQDFFQFIFYKLGTLDSGCY